MKKVISTSFFRHEASEYEQPEAGEGRGRFFVNYLRSFIRAHTYVFPDWEWRIHHDERVKEYSYFRCLQRFESEGLCRLVPMDTAQYLTGSMLWRLVPCWDKDIGIVAFRDLDHLPTPREYRAVMQWVESKQAAHGIQDSESHMGTLFMGGLTSLRIPCSALDRWPTFSRFKETWFDCKLNRKGADQYVLNAILHGIKSANDYTLDTTNTMPHRHVLDSCEGHARHAGGAFHVEPVVKFYDENGYTDDRILRIEREVLGAS